MRHLSLGRLVVESYTTDPLCLAVEKAWKAGIVVVVAAGNEGRNDSMGTSAYATITSPGNDPYVITVGAMKTMGTTTRNDDFGTSYSSKEPTLIDHVIKLDLVARSPMSVLGAKYPETLVPNEYWTTNTGWAPQYIKPDRSPATRHQRALILPLTARSQAASPSPCISTINHRTAGYTSGG